ncbi:MAG: heme-binding protein A [Dehalococcoidia bacterium]|nr:MAG: heme-binding protein A [Dehalococcoidia bacterium]
MRLALWLLSLLAALVVACAPAASPTTGGAAQPTGERRAANQALRIAKAGLPGGVTPELSSSNNEIFYAIFDTLTTYGKNFELRPAVATRWEFRQAESAWRFTLRQDLEFSNGQKLTADDVVYSANLIVQKNLPTRSFLPSLDRAVKVNETTVDLISRTPDFTLVAGTPWVSVFPAAYHQQVGRDFATRPIGSGPYELAEFRPADVIRFKLRSASHPYRQPIATELEFRAIPELTQQISGLRAGEIDIAQSNFNSDQAEQLKRAGLVVQTLLTENNFALFSQPEMKVRNTPLNDRRVRLALNYAVNKEAIANDLFKGYAQPVGQFGFPGSEFWNPETRPIPYDPAQARRLLAEAGYPNGFKLPVGIEYTPQTVNPEIAVAVQGMLREVGVEMEVASYEFAQFLDKYYGRQGQQKGDLFMVSNGNTTPYFTSGRGRFGCEGKDFEIWWCNEEFVRLYDLAVQEGDATKRADLFRRANAALVNDIPALFLVIRDGFLVHNPKIKGVEFTTRNIYNYDAAYRVE